VEKSSRQLATFVVSRVRLKRGAIIIQIVASTTEIDCDLCACFCCCRGGSKQGIRAHLEKNSSDVKDECVGCHRAAAFRETFTKEYTADFTWKLKNRFLAHAMQLGPKRRREVISSRLNFEPCAILRKECNSVGIKFCIFLCTSHNIWFVFGLSWFSAFSIKIKV
jgi:hypothetical protein